MSILKVDTIQKADGTGSLSVPAESGTVVTTASPSLGRRNLLINSDFQVSQRGDYTSATAIPTSSTYYLDRFKCRRNGVTGNFTHKLNQTLGNNDVVNTLRLDVTSTATGRVELIQIIEDFNWFKNKTITFSAQVKSNSTDARLVFNVDGGGGTTASTAHTGGGEWELLTGTATLTSGVTGVQLYAGIQATVTGDVAGVTSGDYFEITEIQVEVGSVATPFEHRSYGEELALCQRYYEKSYDYDDIPGTVTSEGVHKALPHEYNGNTYGQAAYFLVPKRTTPTMSFWNQGGTSGQWQFYTSSTGTGRGLSATDIGHNRCGYVSSGTTGYTSSQGHWVADAEL